MNINRQFEDYTEGMSYRRIFLTQPPVTEVQYSMEGRVRIEREPWYDSGGLPQCTYETVYIGSIKNADGVTFGEVVDLMVSLQKIHSYWTLSSLRFPGVFAVTAEQREFFEVAEVVTSEADPWLKGMAAWSKRKGLLAASSSGPGGDQ